MTARAYFRLWLDDRRVGCGWRAFVLLKRGRKFAHLVEPASGRRLKLPVAELRHAQPIACPRWRHIARQLRAHAATRGLAARIIKECR